MSKLYIPKTKPKTIDNIPDISKKRFYSSGYISSQPIFEAVLYFIHKMIERGAERALFEGNWLQRTRQTMQFWKMKEINNDPGYWKNVIDLLFIDNYWNKRASRLKDIVNYAEKVRFNSIEKLDEKSEFLKELSIRIGEVQGMYNKNFDKYFNGSIPTKEACQKFGILKDFRRIQKIKNLTGIDINLQ